MAVLQGPSDVPRFWCLFPGLHACLCHLLNLTSRQSAGLRWPHFASYIRPLYSALIVETALSFTPCFLILFLGSCKTWAGPLAAFLPFLSPGRCLRTVSNGRSELDYLPLLVESREACSAEASVRADCSVDFEAELSHRSHLRHSLETFFENQTETQWAFLNDTDLLTHHSPPQAKLISPASLSLPLTSFLLLRHCARSSHSLRVLRNQTLGYRFKYPGYPQPHRYLSRSRQT